MDENDYKIGDFVYIEGDPTQPYLVRRIDGLQTISNSIGTICNVTCFFRRRDLPERLLKFADKVENVKISSTKILISTIKNKCYEQLTEKIPEEKAAACTATTEEESTGMVERHFGGLPSGADKLSPKELHLLQHRQLFMSRQRETLNAKDIRGKCQVVFLSDVDTPETYLGAADQFFYSYIYDRTSETVISDKRSVQLGPNHQAVIDEPSPIVLKKLTEERKRKETSLMDDSTTTVCQKDEEEPQAKKFAHPRSTRSIPVLPNGREKLLYHPHHKLKDTEIDQFLILAKAVGTFARAFDTPNVTKIPTLHVAAAAASRDTTHLHALSLLHQSGYNLSKASKYLVPIVKNAEKPPDIAGPLLCRDELEHWSPAEAYIFTEGLEKFNKDFNEIRQNYLPWKNEKDIIEYYYMFKTSDRYAANRRPKKEEKNRGKLNHAIILPYTKSSPFLIPQLSSANGSAMIVSPTECESCHEKQSISWYFWGPKEKKMQVCQNCWNYWKKNGGLMREHECERFCDGGYAVAVNPDLSPPMTLQQYYYPVSIFNFNNVAFLSPFVASNLLNTTSVTVVMPESAKVFVFRSTAMLKLARKLAPKEIYNVKKVGRTPFKSMNTKALMDSFFRQDPVSIIFAIKKYYSNITISTSFIELLTRMCQRSTR